MLKKYGRRLLPAVVAALSLATLSVSRLSENVVDNTGDNTGDNGGVKVVLMSENQELCRLCAAVADTQGKRETGLSGIRELKGFDGMLFPMKGSSGASFWMKGVLFPIDVYLFDESGGLIASHSMDTCINKECSLYEVPAETLWALEIPSYLKSVTSLEFSTIKITEEPCNGHLAGSLDGATMEE